MSYTSHTSQHPVGRLAQRFYRDRRLLVLTVLLVLASGLSSLLVLPQMEDPLLTQRAATVTTLLPGADAERVEALVTEKIEEKLRDVPEIKRLRSQSRAGVSFISIELLDELYDTPPVWSVIRGKIEDSIARLPREASRPAFDETDVAAYAWIGAITWERSDTALYGLMRRLARELKDSLTTLPGTKNVDLFGDPLEEVIVEIDAVKAAAVGLSAGEIAAQLQSSDVKSGLGLVRSAERELVVEMQNEFHDLADILDANLQATKTGQVLRLRDVATVRRATREPPAARAIVDGKDAVVVAAMLRPEFRIDHWSVAAQRVLGSFESQLPSGVQLTPIMEQHKYVDSRMRSLKSNLLLGVCAVAIVTLVFLGWRSSLLVTATLPLASLMVLAGMRMLGIPIHQMSVTGLIIALGMLIDNAIIAADEMEVSFRRGLSAIAAVGDMVQRLFLPLLASTITTALSFAPIALMEGPAGEFVGAIAMTVMLAIFSSLFLSMTILPAVAATFAGHGKSVKEGGFLRTTMQHGFTWAPMTATYRRGLTFMLQRPWTGILLGCTLPLLGFAAATQLDEQFFPPADRDQFFIEVEHRPDASLAETQSLTRKIDARLNTVPRISHMSWFLGESAPPFYYNIISRRKGNPNYAQAIITLKDNESALRTIRDLQRSLSAEFPEARILVRQLEQGPPFDAPLEVRFFGSDLAVLQDYGEQLRQLATELPEVIHVRTALGDSRPVASVRVDATQAAWAGLTQSDVADQLFARLEGLPAGSIIEEVEQLPVRVRVTGAQRESLEDLNEAALTLRNRSPLAGGNGSSSVAVDNTTSLSSLATIELRPQRAVVTRYNGRRVNEVQGFLVAGTLPSTALKAFQQKLQQARLKVPEGYEIDYGGEASERNTAVQRLLANVSILVVGMIASLVLALGSFRLAGLIGVVALLSVGLGMGSLWVFGFPFGFMAIIGTMGLIGIAINDSIVVVAAIASNERIRSGDQKALVDTMIECTRHVLATTATTVVGFLPLLISGGSFWPPLAVTIAGGVAGATLIALTLVPSVMQWIVFPRQSRCSTASGCLRGDPGTRQTPSAKAQASLDPVVQQ